jgi:tetratricopeptide (TPR) repeat protein
VNFRTLRGRFVLGAGLLLGFVMQAFAAADWVSVKSTNFNLAGEVTESELRTVAERLEHFRDIFAQLFPQFGASVKARANVIIFRDAESFKPFKPKRPDGTADESVAGYFLASENVNYITLALRGGKTDPFHTIFHEYLHFLLKSRAGKNDLPPWLSEGLAQYFETLEVTTDGRVVIGTAPQGRVSTLRRGELIPESEFFSIARTAVQSGGGVPRSVFYAQSWLVVHYLLHHGEGRLQERVERFLRIVDQSDSAANALKQIYGIDAGQLNEALRTYLQLPALPVSVLPVGAKPASILDNSAVRIPPAMTQAYLGDLLHHMDRLNEAEAYLRGALAADNRLGLANSSLGLLLIRQEKWDEATRFLEMAVSEGSADYLVHFNYAYALSRASAPGGMVSQFPPAPFSRMAESLKRSIDLKPDFAQSYRVLAFIYLVNGENLSEAAALLEKGLSLKPGDENFEVLLAKALVRINRYDDARGYAERLSQKATDPQVRADAAEILSSIRQYSKARLEITTPVASRNPPWSPSLVLLKRSWVTDADLQTVERERENTNLNRVLERPRSGEQRILGTIQSVDCVGGSITYNVRAGNGNFKLYGDRFDNLRMAVIVSGEHSFGVDCGVRLALNPAVLSFTVPVNNRVNPRPQLMSITFVPEGFKLKTPEELAASRHVVIENDLLKRVPGTSVVVEKGGIDTDGRWASIRAELRPPKAGEVRMTGTLESIDCSGNDLSVVATIDGKRQKFMAGKDLLPRWFGVEATQVSLACGSLPAVPNVLFTYRLSEAEGTGQTELVGLEFLPSGFPLSSVIGRAR